MKTDKDGNPLLTQFSEEGFVDCAFRIADLAETGTDYRFRLLASHDGELVGMAVTVVKGIRAGLDADAQLIQDHVYRHGVVFSRSGPESDRLIRALAQSYGTPDASLQMVPVESFTAIALHLSDIDMESESVKLKLFGQDGSDQLDDDYYESFFHVDLTNRQVFWNEKDQDYREPLLRALST